MPGTVMLDIEGEALSAEDRELLASPAVGGLILFSRNYSSPEQLRALCAEVHAIRDPRLLIAVDHEGGRVQRFRDGFTRLPPASELGAAFDRDPDAAVALARDAGWLMAAELRAVGVDLSFAPVLDLDQRCCAAIGDRALHADADAVTRLARALVSGMREAGMAAVGKHFPGHGGVREDSHVALPVDRRDLASFRMHDLLPFERLIEDGLPAIMTAHLLVPEVDGVAVSFSRRWIDGVLRGSLGFRGAVFSDDLSMHAARAAGTPAERAAAALAAGCDMVLVCNDRDAASAAVEALDGRAVDPVRVSRLARLHGRRAAARETLLLDPRHRRVEAALGALDPTPELDLGDDNPA